MAYEYCNKKCGKILEYDNILKQKHIEYIDMQNKYTNVLNKLAMDIYKLKKALNKATAILHYVKCPPIKCKKCIGVEQCWKDYLMNE